MVDNVRYTGTWWYNAYQKLCTPRGSRCVMYHLGEVSTGFPISRRSNSQALGWPDDMLRIYVSAYIYIYIYIYKGGGMCVFACLYFCYSTNWRSFVGINDDSDNQSINKTKKCMGLWNMICVTKDVFYSLNNIHESYYQYAFYPVYQVYQLMKCLHYVD